MAVSSGNQDELVLVERVFLRIGSADTDEQLENVLAKFLPPVLLKLSSPQEGVRKKVMELLVHVNRRLKSRLTVKLPVETLLLQYQDPSATGFIKNFTIIYIKMGFPRLDAAKQIELAIPLLNGLETSPQSHQDSVLLLVANVLGTTEFKGERAKADLAVLREKPVVLKMLLDFILDILLLPYGMTWPSTPAPGSSAGDSDPAAASSAGQPPPGMCEYSVRRVLGDQPPPAADRLEQLKTGLVRFLTQGALPAVQVAPHLLVALADTRFSVANLADMELKRISEIDWDDSGLITTLCNIYLGTLVPKEKPELAPKPELRRTPVSTRIRLKLLPYLNRSRTAATLFPQSLQVMFDSLYGTNTNPKLKHLALQFIIQVIQQTPETKLAPIGAVILGVLHRILSDERGDARLRSVAYTAVGRLGSKLPAVVNRDLSTVQMFFDALEQEEAETAQFVQDTLHLLAPSLRGIDAAQRTMLEALLASRLERDSVRARQVAVLYAAEVFPDTHANARLLLLLATADSKDEVAAEALKRLKIVERDVQDDSKAREFPDFAEMVECITRKAQERQTKRQVASVGNRTLAFPPAAYGNMVRYLSLCLQHAAASDTSVCLELVRGRSAGLPAALRSPQLAVPLSRYAQLTMELLRAQVTETPLFCLLETLACGPEQLVSQLTDQRDWIKSLVCYPRELVRVYAAELFSIMASVTLDDQAFTKTLDELHQMAKSKVLERQHGGLLALGYCLARRARLGRPPSHTDPHIVQLFSDILVYLEDQSQVALFSALCDAVAEMGRTGPLPAADGPADQSAPPTKHHIVQTLLNVTTRKSLVSKVRERAVVAVGCICVGDPKLELRREILQHYLSISKELDELEVQMAVGETLVCTVLGPRSPEARDPWLAAGDDPVQPPTGLAADYQPDELLNWLIRQLLENQLTQTHPRVRQSAAVWLLALVKRCQDQQPIRDNLTTIQSAFMELLASGNDLAQDAASRGLALVYDCGDGRQRHQLVEALVGALTGDPRQARTQKLSANDRVFAEGEIGKDPSGGQLSTYKELCSLASDLNQPDLIYKFMMLANHNASWNSRRGAAFGFSSIAARASGALKPHLANIVPKLYRYQFDPKPQIQGAMSSIWSAIVPESSKTVQQYLPQIVDEVLAHLTDSTWRVRESCCAALAELLSTTGSGGLEPVLDRLPEMWTTLFRVRDDIKESVRNAAQKTLDALSRVCIRLCEQQESSKISAQTMSLVLPVLLETGITSTVAEVRSVSLWTVMQLAKSAGRQLRPHLHQLMPVLLEALSGLESATLRYLSVRLAGQSQAEAQETMDRARLSASKESPMFKTLTQCIQYVDETELGQLVPRLSELMKKNTGLGTKCGVALFISRLAVERPSALQQHAGKLLSVLVHGMGDRNVTVRRTCASVCGNVCRVARASSLEKLLAKLRTWYLNTEDEWLRPVSGLALQSMCRNSLSQLKDHSAQAASLAFFAMHQPKTPETESEVALWEEIWNDLVPGTDGGLRLYLSEIVELCRSALGSQSWRLKAQAAATLGAAAARPGAHLHIVLEALLAALPGRTWDGKQALLEALASVCRSCAAELVQPELVAEAVLREAGRERLDYKVHAVRASGEVLQALQLDKFPQLYHLLEPYLQETSSNGNSGDSEDDAESRSTRLELQEAAYTALGRAWPTNKHTQVDYLNRYLMLLALAMPRSTRSHQLVIVTSLRPVVARLWLLTEPSGEEDQKLLLQTIHQMANILTTALEVPKFPSLRREALAVVRDLLAALRAVGTKFQFPVSPAVGALRARLGSALETAAGDPSHELQAAAADVTQMISQLASS